MCSTIIANIMATMSNLMYGTPLQLHSTHIKSKDKIQNELNEINFKRHLFHIGQEVEGFSRCYSPIYLEMPGP